MKATAPAAWAALLTLLLGSTAQAAPTILASKSDGFLRQTLAAKPTQGWQSVIAQWNGPLTPPRRRSLKALQAVPYRHLGVIHADALRVPTRNLARLTALPFVRHLSADLNCRKSDEYTTEATGADVAFSQDGLTGAGVTVAVLDSGIQTPRVDIQGRTLANVSFVGDGTQTDDACGHGTHVAGIVAGDGTASSGPSCFRTFYGMARGANLVNVRVLDANGQGSVSGVIQGIGWIVAHKFDYGIRVLNLSLGHPVGESYLTDPLCQAVEAAWQAGIVVVCAAGNSGRLASSPNLISGLAGNEGWGTAYGSIQSPANDPDVITVGAMKSVDGQRTDDRIATYSSRGPSRLDFVLKPDLVAPGNRIVSVCANGSTLDTNYGALDGVAASEYSTGGVPTDDRYLRLSGTSMAAPVVSGAAALLLQADPTLSPDTVKARLMISADKSGYGTLGMGSKDACTYGAGYLDVPAALACSYVATRPALSPALARSFWGRVSIKTQPLLTGGGGLWGTGLGLGDVWGSQVIWGENTLSGSQVIWGESVWGSQVIWGESTGSADLSSTALVGDPDALSQGPLSFLLP